MLEASYLASTSTNSSHHDALCIKIKHHCYDLVLFLAAHVIVVVVTVIVVVVG